MAADFDFNLSSYYTALRAADLRAREGKVSKISGMSVEATGLLCSIGDICTIRLERENKEVVAEVVGIAGSTAYLMPYEEIDGIGYDCPVINTGDKLRINVSDALINRTVDALGNPIDGGPPIAGGVSFSIGGAPANPFARPPITECMEMGVKSIDGLLTIGKGQRMGIFAGSGVGKSTLMGMIARNVRADINVIALVGERGREVVEFIERDLGPEGKARSVLVVATSDQPAIMRYKCPQTATSIAEYFQRQGKHVLLMMDSLTRFSMAQREIGLASGEPPVTRGYPPSVYSEMPKLLERAGCAARGSITGLYTVLVDGDDFNEPITDTARSILDGHIMLDRKLGHKNHYPAIDILQSISRCMSQIADGEHKQAAGKLKNVLATYNEAEDLINIGAYKSGSNPSIDYAISKIDAVNGFLCQDVDEKFSFEDSVAMLERLFESK